MEQNSAKPLASAERISELRAKVAIDPGADELIELADALCHQPEVRPELRELCFRGLTANPAQRLVRLALARSFYLDGMYEFAVRELLELRRGVESSLPSLDRLISAFGPYATQFAPGTAANQGTGGSASESDSPEATGDVVAEIDLETDFLDVLKDIEND